MPIARPVAGAIVRPEDDADDATSKHIIAMWNDEGEWVGQFSPSSQEYKYKRFVEEYLVDFDVGRAALAAGFTPDGDHVRANTTGKRLCKQLTKVINARTKTLAGRCGINAETVLTEIKNIAYSNIADLEPYLEGKVRLKDMPRHITAAIKKITVDVLYAGAGTDREAIGEKIKVELYDKVNTLKMLGSHLGVSGTTDGDGQPGGQIVAPIILLFGDSTQAPRLQVESTVVPDAVLNAGAA
jgi:hypothetical protein